MHPHNHALDCFMDPAMPAVFRSPRWPGLARNPLAAPRHMGGISDANARRLHAAALAQELGMPDELASFNAGLLVMRNNITFGEAVDTMATYAASLAAGPNATGADHTEAAEPSEVERPAKALARLSEAFRASAARVCQSHASASASSAPRK